MICLRELVRVMNGMSFIWRHYLNQCWLIVDWTFRDKFQWHFDVFYSMKRIRKYRRKMAIALSRHQCINPSGVETGTFKLAEDHGLWCPGSLSPLRWHHNGRDSVSNHHPHDCLLNRLFRRRSKKHQSSASLAFVPGIHRGPVNSPHKWPVTRKIFPFDDVILTKSSSAKIFTWYRINKSLPSSKNGENKLYVLVLRNDK